MTNGDQSMDWNLEVESRCADLGKRIQHQVIHEVKSELDQFVTDMRVFPKARALTIEVFAFDTTVKTFALESVLLEWLDVPYENAIASREQLEAWASGLEGMAQRLRKAIAEGRHTDADNI